MANFMIECKNCGHEFETGNFCPRCGTKVTQEETVPEYIPESQPVEAVQIEPQTEYEPEPAPQSVYEVNPYEQNYAQPTYEQPLEQPEQQPDPQTIEQPVQQQYQQPQYQQQYAQPLQQPPYQYGQYAYQAPPQKGMTAGKIVALVASIVVGVALVIYGPFGFWACSMAGEGDISNPPKTIDTTPYTSDSSARLGDLEVTVSDISFSQTFDGKKAKEGKEYLSLTANLKNVGKEDVTTYDIDFELIADNISCKEYTSEDEEDFYNNGTLSQGTIEQNDLTYIVPKNAETITLKVTGYEDENHLKQINFTIK